MNNSGDLHHGALAGLVRHGPIGTRAGYLSSVYFQHWCRQEGAAETTRRLWCAVAVLGVCVLVLTVLYYRRRNVRTKRTVL